MQLKYFLFLCVCALVIGLSVSSCPVLASSSHGGGSGSHETENTEPSHGGEGGNHAVTDDVIFNNIVQPFKVIWNWCLTTKVRLGSHSFSFANFYLWQILAIIAVWFIGYYLYNR